jgi:hypothetical protein
MRTKAATRSARPSRARLERDTIRTGSGTDAIAKALIDSLHCLQAKSPQHRRFSSDRSIREYCRDIWNVQLATPAER